MITSENYVQHAVRTDCEYTPEMEQRVLASLRLLHASMGLVTEAGELMDMLKKHIFYGKQLDCVNAIEECGDAEWYIALALDEMKQTMNEVLTLNIQKLRRRYPDKFTSECAIERNVESERVLLETGTMSKRGADWLAFSDKVLAHINNYTVPQYGDKGEDQITDWTIEECLLAVKKRLSRYGKNVRENQQTLDFLKMVHETQIAYEKFLEAQNETN